MVSCLKENQLLTTSLTTNKQKIELKKNSFLQSAEKTEHNHKRGITIRYELNKKG